MMNRRTLLQRLLAGAAAIAGAGLAAPSVVRAEASEGGGLKVAAGGLTVTGNTTFDGNLTIRDTTIGHNTTLGGAGRVINLVPGNYLAPIDLRGVSNVTIRGAGPDQTTITHPTTFDDLAWASAIRKASESEDDQITVFVDDMADSMRDALTRRGQALYPDEDYITADMMNHVMKTEDDVADAYERGRAIESARAESRQALGLPLNRDADA